MFDIIYNPCRPLAFYSFFCATKGDFCGVEIRWETSFTMKKYGKGRPIFFWACIGMELKERATHLHRVQDLLDSSPNSLHA